MAISPARADSPAETPQEKPSEADVEQHPLTFVEFFDPTCPVCARMEPVVEQVRGKWEPRLLGFEIVNLGESEGLNRARARSIRNAPTFLLLDENAQELDRLVGETSAATLDRFLELGVQEIRYRKSREESSSPGDDPSDSSSSSPSNER